MTSQMTRASKSRNFLDRVLWGSGMMMFHPDLILVVSIYILVIYKVSKSSGPRTPVTEASLL